MILNRQRVGKGYHPFQILFARMGISVVCASLYMWRSKTEHFPFGMKEVRLLLVARGLTGFFGVFGMYCKLTRCNTTVVVAYMLIDDRFVTIPPTCRCHSHNISGS